MNIEIKKVRYCREKESGYFEVLSRNRGRIVVSLKRNPTLGEYASTLLHELLHLYIKLLISEGFVLKKGEHAWINSCERAVINLMRRHLKGRK